jgi:hypothetical protein
MVHRFGCGLNRANPDPHILRIGCVGSRFADWVSRSTSRVEKFRDQYVGFQPCDSHGLLSIPTILTLLM